MTTPRNPERSGDLNVIVVSYGSPALLREALAPLRGTYPTIVVDNSSLAEAKDVANEAEARYVDPGQNLGFARAVNVGLGLRHPPDADVLLLNPDAQISVQGVDRLLEVLRADPTLACVAPTQRVPGADDLSPVWWPWHTPAGAWMEAIGLRRWRAPQGFLSGAVLLLSGAAVKDVGLLDERYFMYSEEEDWQQRARRRGWRFRLCPEVEALHRVGGTDSDIIRVQLRVHIAIERYVRKWFGRSGWAAYRVGTVFGCGLRMIAYQDNRRRRIGRLARTYVEGPEKAGHRAGAIPG